MNEIDLNTNETSNECKPDTVQDKNRKPSVIELCEYTGLPLFTQLCEYMESEYKPVTCVEYSGESGYSGWNIKFKKAGRTLCTLYPRSNSFMVLVVIGRREAETVSKLLPTLSESFRSRYDSTSEMMGQRWMMFTFSEYNNLYSDILQIIRVRRESKPIKKD